MTREELLNIGFDTKEVEAFGGQVMVRDLTIAEAGKVAAASDDFKAMVLAVSYALVDPKMSIQDLESMSAKSAEDFALILKQVAS